MSIIKSIIKGIKRVLNGAVWAVMAAVLLSFAFDGLGLLENGLIVTVIASFMAGAFGYYIAGGETK